MQRKTIAIVGMTKAGQVFLAEMLRCANRGVDVLAVCCDAEGAQSDLLRDVGIRRQSIDELVEFGEKLDIIFDFSGEKSTRAKIRQSLFCANNEHTVIAPESVAELIYLLFSEPRAPASKAVIQEPLLV